jgi:hypothetical protein
VFEGDFDCDGVFNNIDCEPENDQIALIDACGECGGDNPDNCYGDGVACAVDSDCITDSCDECGICGGPGLNGGQGDHDCDGDINDIDCDYPPTGDYETGCFIGSTPIDDCGTTIYNDLDCDGTLNDDDCADWSTYNSHLDDCGNCGGECNDNGEGMIICEPAWIETLDCEVNSGVCYDSGTPQIFADCAGECGGNTTDYYYYYDDDGDSMVGQYYGNICTGIPSEAVEINDLGLITCGSEVDPDCNLIDWFESGSTSEPQVIKPKSFISTASEGIPVHILP